MNRNLTFIGYNVCIYVKIRSIKNCMLGIQCIILVAQGVVFFFAVLFYLELICNDYSYFSKKMFVCLVSAFICVYPLV